MDDSDIPGDRNSVFPRNEQESVRSLVGLRVLQSRGYRLATRLYSYGRLGHHVSPFCQRELIRKAACTSRVHGSTTRTLVGQIRIDTQLLAIGSSDGLVVKTKTT